MEEDSMARLMVGCDLLILFGNDLAPLLSADPYLHKGAVDIILTDKTAVLPCGENGCLVHQVFQIRSRKTGGRLSNPVQIHVLAERLFLGVHL